MLYWFSLLQCWLLQLHLYMTLLYSYSLITKLRVIFSTADLITWCYPEDKMTWPEDKECNQVALFMR